MKNKIITICVLTVLSLLWMSNANGVANRNGAPGETACNASGCHTSNALNSGGGSITITDNIPTTGYIPGQTYTINVTVAKTGVNLFGFGFEAVSSSNTTAGTLVVLNAASTKTLNGTRTNMVHLTNSGVSASSKTFTFGWIAPSTPNGNVTFYAAGNAANGNGSDTGDYIYTTTKTITPSPLTTGTVSGSPFCGNSSGISIPYVASGTFSTGNVFTAELSDASGSFANPLALGSVTSTSTGTIISSVPLPNIAGTAYVIRVTSTLPALIGLQNTNSLTIVAAPSTANAGSNQNVCGSSATLSANAPAIGTGSWTVVNGTANFASTTNPSTTVSGLSNGTNTLRWTVTNGACASSISNVVITSYAAPSLANAGSNQTVCANFVSLSATLPTLGTGTWTLLSGTGTILSANSYSTLVTGLSTGTNNFVWTVGNGPCASNSASVQIVYAGSITISNAGPDQAVCANTATLAANQAIAGIGTWSLISGTGNITAINSNTSTVTGLGLGVNIFRWIISNGACTPSTDDVAITSVTVSPAVVANNSSQCSTSGSISATNPTNGSGSWQIASGTASLSSPLNFSSSVSGLSPGNNVFIWTVSNAPCASNSATLIINQSGTIGIADAGLDQAICSNTFGLNAATPSVGSGTWSVVSGSGIFANNVSPFSGVSNLALGTNVLRWTVGNGTCATVYDDLSINTSTISSASTGANQTICSNSCILTSTAPQYGLGLWSVFSGTGSIQNPNSAFTAVTGLGYGVTVFRWTVSNAPCPPSVKDVTVNNCTTNSLVTNAILGAPFCNSTAYSVMISFSTTGIFLGYFTAQLSDATGSFLNPVAIGSGPSSPISAYIPANTSAGSAYRIRVVSSAPPVNGTNNGVNLAINNCEPNYIKLDSTAWNPLCEETSYQLIIPFVIGGTVTPPYVAEISDFVGNFANATSIGYSYASPITAVVPSGMPIGYNYKVRVKSNADGIYSLGSSNNISVNTCEITGLTTNSGNKNIQVFPSASDKEFYISSNKDVQDVKLSVYDLTGRLLIEKNNLNLSTNSQTTIDISSLSPQLYLIHIETNEIKINTKFLKY
jgi:hypothetical protein